MPFKSILRALWPFRRKSALGTLGEAISGIQPQATPFLDRLTARSDWQTTPGNWTTYKPASDPWPVTDDPYARPEPCDVVPDAGAVRLDQLQARGLMGVPGSTASVQTLFDLIDRQQDAEDYLRKIGMTWERGRGWYLP